MPLIDISTSEVRLDPRGNPLRETPVPRFARSEGFERHVDRNIVVADIFRDAAGNRILLLVRPLGRYWNPLSELSIRCADSGRVIPATRFPEVKLSGPEWLALDAPGAVSALEIAIGGQRVFRPVQPNLSRLFAGRRVLVTMCRDEPVERIADWAHWHADRHGFDAVLLYDNGSAATKRGEITEALNSVPGIEAAVTLDWPGMAWLAISEPPWAALEAWSQRGSIRHAILRFLQHAECVFCSDVDELLLSFDPSGAPIIDSLLADDSVDAIRFMSQDAVLPDSTRSGLRHRDVEAFTGELRRKFKWLARPRRFGLDRLPDQHNPDLPAIVEIDPAHARLAHFRQLTTGWGGRQVRLDPAPANPAFDADSRELRRQLDEVYGRWSWTAPAPAPPTIDDLRRDAWMLIEAGDYAAALARIDAALAEEPRQPVLVAARRDLIDRLPAEPG